MTSTAAELNPYKNTHPGQHPGVYEKFGDQMALAVLPWMAMAWQNAHDNMAPRVISMVAELDALPVGSVLLAQGDLTGEEQYDKVAFTKGRRTHGNAGYRYASVGSTIYTSEHFFETWETITVLWVGGTE